MSNKTTNERIEQIGEAISEGMAQMASGKPWRANRPDHQAFDEIRIITVPRYKQSGLSGDEWRISARIDFYRKGHIVHSESWRNISTAAEFLNWSMTKANEDGHGYSSADADYCDQEGCAEKAVITYRKKANYCNDGHKTDPHRPTIRRFCEKHRQRGDCGLDDADNNYEIVQ